MAYITSTISVLSHLRLGAAVVARRLFCYHNEISAIWQLCAWSSYARVSYSRAHSLIAPRSCTVRATVFWVRHCAIPVHLLRVVENHTYIHTTF